MNISKFYLHDAATGDTGTLPGASTISASSPYVTATGASTCRTLNATAGASVVEAAVAIGASRTNKTGWLRRFLSAPLAAQTISGTVVLSDGRQTGSSASSGYMRFVLGVWRPSTGGLVGLLYDGATVSESTSFTSTAVVRTSAARTLSSLAVLAGDVLVLETWFIGTSGVANGNFREHYDGTTEGDAANEAAYISFSNAIIFSTPKALSASFTPSGGLAKQAQKVLISPQVAPSIGASAPGSVGSDTSDLPSGRRNGDYLLAVSAALATGIVPTWPAGWTNCGQYAGPSGVCVGSAYRVVDGTEGTSVQATWAGSPQCTTGCLLITGAADVHTAATATGSSASPDPASMSPGWGSLPIRWVTVMAANADGVDVTGNPAGFTSKFAGYGVGRPSLYVDTAAITAASEDPGAYAYAGSHAWDVLTIAFKPAPPSGSALGPSGFLSTEYILGQITKAISGALTFAGGLAIKAYHGLAGGLAPSGVTARKTDHGLAGAGLTPAGGVTKQTNRGIAANLRPTGALARAQRLARALAGGIAPGGTLKRLVGAHLGGAFTPTGTLARSLRYRLALVASVLTPSGAITTIPGRVFRASLAPAGALQRDMSTGLASALAPAGGLARAVAHQLDEAILTPAGALVRAFVFMLGGASLTPSGALGVVRGVVFTASLAAWGMIHKATSRGLPATITMSAQLRHSARKVFGAGITPAGSLARRISKRVVAGLHSVGSLSRALVGGPVIYTLELFAGLTPQGSIVRTIAKGLRARLGGRGGGSFGWSG